MPDAALLLWRSAWPPVNDPVTVTLFERPSCGYGCAGCLVCRPQVALTAEGAAAFAATGLVTVTSTTIPGVFALAATDEDRGRDRRCSHCEGGTENTDQLRDLRWWDTSVTLRGGRSTPCSLTRIPTWLVRWPKRSSWQPSARLPAGCFPANAKSKTRARSCVGGYVRAIRSPGDSSLALAVGDPLRRIRVKTSPKTSCCSPPP